MIDVSYRSFCPRASDTCFCKSGKTQQSSDPPKKTHIFSGSKTSSCFYWGGMPCCICSIWWSCKVKKIRPFYHSHSRASSKTPCCTVNTDKMMNFPQLNVLETCLIRYPNHKIHIGFRYGFPDFSTCSASRQRLTGVGVVMLGEPPAAFKKYGQDGLG